MQSQEAGTPRESLYLYEEVVVFLDGCCANQQPFLTDIFHESQYRIVTPSDGTGKKYLAKAVRNEF